MSTTRRARAAGSALRPATGPSATLLAASIPRRYYMDGASKSEIAAEVGIRRFKVARVRDGGRSSGLVRIELHYEGDIDLDLSVELGARYGLRRCLVIDTADDEAALVQPRADRSGSAVGGRDGR